MKHEEVRRSRPISRVLSWAAIHLRRTSPCACSSLPGSGADNTIGSLFGLAPGGVYPATPVTSRAVRSYRTISPLPPARGPVRRYIFCGTFRGLAPPRNYLAPCPVEPGLSSTPPKWRSDCLAGSSVDAIMGPSARPHKASFPRAGQATDLTASLQANAIGAGGRSARDGRVMGHTVPGCSDAAEHGS